MINQKSIEWAIDFISNHGDGDLFPRILEFEAIKNMKVDFAQKLSSKDLSQINVGAHRRLIVPKDEVSFRGATQLAPLDNIILTAIIYEYGQLIENRRLSKSQIFSYRFGPDLSNGLYSEKDMWNTFWTEAHKKSLRNTIIYCDIADFYNQIYHHVLENQLIETGFPKQIIQWIKRLFSSTTASVSQGLPIGPHAIHLLAELTLIPIDNSLKSKGYNFIRYADDIIIFCKEKEAQKILMDITNTLDKQQHLMLQRHKTKIYSAPEFRKFCVNMIEDQPINKEEKSLLDIIKKYSNGNPYSTIMYNNISDDDWKSIKEEVISKIILQYLQATSIDYIRLRWFYRRLTQIGHSGAINITFSEFNKLTPCLANISTYLGSIQAIEKKDWRSIGTKILRLLDSDIIKITPYYSLQMLSLFSKNKFINHFAKLVTRFDNSESFAKREILLAAKINGASDWLREQKENYKNMDSWQKAAFLYGIADLPKEERGFFIRKQKYEDIYLETIADWAAIQ